MKSTNATAHPLSPIKWAIGVAIMAATLVGCGGGGGGGGAPAVSKLFAADSAHAAIGSLNNPNPGAGAQPVDRIILGPSTGLIANNIGSLALDAANDRLYVGSATSILVFNGASTDDGNVAPARIINHNGAVSSMGSLFLDTVNNRLYAGDTLIGVRVINGADAANGTVASNRTITGDFGTQFSIHGVAVDATKNILYVSNSTITPSSSHQISIFDGADTVNGSKTPDRKITPMISTTNFPIAGIFLDTANDRLYVSSSQGGTFVMVFDGASTATGPTSPTKTIVFPNALSNVVLDTAHDRLYAVSPGAIYVLNSASTATGVVSAIGIPVPNGGTFTAVAVSP